MCQGQALDEGPETDTSMKILIVEDELKTADYLYKGLTEQGCTVDIAYNGIDGQHLALQHDYDVIVSDWKMPGLDGMNLYRVLLERKPEAARRMLFMTGDVIKDSFQNFLKQNARTCLPKPFALREFHAAVAGIIQTG